MIIAAGAVVGGTASKLGGGKFSNGAMSGAFVECLMSWIKIENKLKFDGKELTVLDKNGRKFILL